MRDTHKNLILLIELSEDAYLSPSKIGHLYLNRFAIDEDAGFEVLGIHYLQTTSRQMVDQKLTKESLWVEQEEKGNVKIPISYRL